MHTGYIDQLQSFADGYNSTVHKTIDMAPKNVTEDNEEAVWIAMYNKKKTKYTFKALQV